LHVYIHTGVRVCVPNAFPPISQDATQVPNVPTNFSRCYPSSQCAPQHVPNRSSSLLNLSHILGPKFYSCNLLRSLEEKIATYQFWDGPKLDYLLYFLGDGPIKDAHWERIFVF